MAKKETEEILIKRLEQAEALRDYYFKKLAKLRGGQKVKLLEVDLIDILLPRETD